MLKILTGRAGTGKTEYILKLAKEMAKNGKKTLTIVPEQGSFSIEKVFVREIAPEDQDRARISSFKQLSEDVLKQYGGGALPQLSDAGKVAVVRKSINELGASIVRYARAGRDLGLCREIAAAIEEMRNAGVGAELLEMAADRAGVIKGDRLRELAAIYRRAVSNCADKNLDGPDRTIAAAQKMLESGMLGDVTVIFDWFSGFTSSELEMISAMLQTAENVIVTLHGDTEKRDIFETPERTAAQLKDLAGRLGIKTEEMFFPTRYRFRNEGLLTAESLLTDGGVSAGNAGLFRIERPDIYEEVKSVALEINELVREHGYRFRDIAVIARDPREYRSAVMTCFKLMDIPFFCDFDTSIMFSPVIAFARNCARILQSITTENVLEFLKCPLSGYKSFDTGLLESYCEVWDPRGTEWLKPFTKNPMGYEQVMRDKDKRDLAEVEKLRSDLIPKLTGFRDRYKDASADVQMQGIYEFLKQLGGLEIIKEYDQDLIRECSAGFEVMDSIAAIFEGEILSADDLVNIISIEGLATHLKSIPASIDEVTIVDSLSGRLDNPKAVFVLGLNDGDFPRYGSGNRLISQDERDILAEVGAPASVCIDGMDSVEDYNLYRSLSCASERLYICRHEYSGGSKKVPTQLLERLWRAAGDPEYVKNEMSSVINSRTARYEIARDPDSEEAALLETAGLADGSDIRKAMEISDFRLEDTEAEEQLLGKIAKLSPTRIEQYAKCPLAYYFNYILQVGAPEKADVTPISAGKFVHGTMERVLKRLNGDLSSVSERALKDISNEESQKLLEETVGAPEELKPRTLKMFSRLKMQNQRLLLRLRDEMAQSRFVPTDFELGIGRGDIDPLRFESTDGRSIEVNGVVDRVDLYRSDSGKNYIRIVDYKTGTRKFEDKKVRTGEDVQMPLYLLALCENAKQRYGDPIPAGVLYMPSDPDAPDEKKGNRGISAYVPSGIVLEEEEVLRAMERDGEGKYIPYTASGKSGSKWGRTLEDIEALESDAKNAVIESVDRLYSGDICPKPSDKNNSPCTYCKYWTACGRSRRGTEVDTDEDD